MDPSKEVSSLRTRWSINKTQAKVDIKSKEKICIQEKSKILSSFSCDSDSHQIGRVQSHSTVRSKGHKLRIIRPQWLKMTPDAKNKSFQGKIEDNNKEIEKLNSRIRNLIKENFELKGQACGHSFRNIRHNKEMQESLWGDLDSSGRSAMEVTFRPSEHSESPIKIIKRFPRDVFSVPKYLEKFK
jgi:hypothetical protein